MTRVYNRTSEKSKRQLLRRDTPKAEEVLWSKLKTMLMAIEVDGDSHFQRGSTARDEARQAVIGSFGIHFLRFRNVEVFEHLDVVLAAIERNLLELKRKISPP